jgi:beta-lactam-binding protein with PASTA domain/tRNA A-37 threonylcarbamoyl transferase component Bud32
MDTKVADSLGGALINGRYRVRGRVAQGGMATVYTTTDERLERTVALKIIHPGQSRDSRFVERFTDEAKTIARLTHPNVVAVYDQGSYQGLPYLVMEYVHGRTLRALLTDRRRLAPQEALAVMEQVLAAVAAAHRSGLVHRDIKPENVLIAESPSRSSLVDAVVKVADFGLAQAVEDATADGNGAQLMATAAYVAPELVTDGHADPRTDVYSAGIMLFEMLTGRVPYDGDKPIEVAWCHVDQDVPPPSKFLPGLPRSLDKLVEHATRRDAGARPTDAGAMLTEVQTVREGLGAHTADAHAVAQPTVSVSSIAPPTQRIRAAERPTWARLPEPGGGRAAGRAGHAAAGRRGTAQPRESRLVDWYQRVVLGSAHGRQVLAAAIVALGLVIAVGGWWFGAGRYTTAPSLVGQPKSQAVVTAERDGFKVRIESRHDEKVAKDTVLVQTPSANQRIVKGDTITLTLSLGPERHQLPDENGKPYETAADDLTTIKLVPKRVDVYDDSMPAGNVVTTDPPAGTVVSPGTEVTVKVSKGRAPITVPTVINMDANAAQAQLTQLGLQAAIKQQQSDKPANTVLAQSPAAGSGVEKNATIILTVSAGPPMVTVPDVSDQGLNFDQANEILQRSGLVGVPVINLGGQVRNQNPAAGTQVPPGTQVQLWAAL